MRSFWKAKKIYYNDSIIDLFAQTNNINIYWLFQQKEKFNKVKRMYVLSLSRPIQRTNKAFFSILFPIYVEYNGFDLQIPYACYELL